MTEEQIQVAIYNRFSPSMEIVMPNYTPNGWWENDVLAVTRSGYWTEFEIKKSVQDFKNDLKKRKEVMSKDPEFGFAIRSGKLENKHDLLAEKSTRGPSRFYFVLAEDIADKIEVPEWAGKIRAFTRGKFCYCSTEIEAPRLHRKKFDPESIKMMRDACYYRMWSYKTKVTKHQSK